MKRICFIYGFLLSSIILWGQNISFGKITITPYVAGLDPTTTKLLETKLSKIVTENEAAGGFDKRFIIVPSINVLSESETATIPQKTSMKVMITFFVGDGVEGTLFNSYSMEVTGVGDNHNEALHSSIRKINIKSIELQTLIADAKKRIIEYYNSNAPTLISEAEAYMAVQDYENALSRLAVIPSICKHYHKAQMLISKCGNKIIERDNNSLLTKAKAAWSANPNESGANEASIYLSKIVVSSSYYKNEIENLTNKISQRLIQLENKRIELAEAKILSEERLETERINASSKVTSSFISTLPNLVFNVLSWF